MKIILSAIFSLLAVVARAQDITFGLDGAVTQNTQLFYNPQRSDEGTTQMNWMTGFSTCAFARWNNVLKKEKGGTDLRGSLGFFRKGCTMPYQTMAPLFPGAIPGATQIPTYNDDKAQTKLDYLTLDVLLQKRLLRMGGLSLIADAGIGNNLLLGRDIEPGNLDPINTVYPFRTYNDRTVGRYNLSYILGLEVKAPAGYSFFVRTNQSLTPVFLSDNLRVKDWAWVYGFSADVFGKRSGRREDIEERRFH